MITTTRTARIGSMLAAATAVAAVLGTNPASASAFTHEPQPTVMDGTIPPWYAIPIATLRGLTLNQYVTRHEGRVGGATGSEADGER